jgi:prepilin-type N-terminal cleavage/methylation domain-containing protein
MSRKPALTQPTGGLTLVEILVTLAILGILLVLILNLQGSTVQFTSGQDSRARRLATINDVSGYVGDRVKAAALAPDGLTVDGATCSRGAAAPCLTVILPEVDRTCGQVINWTLFAYRYVPRTSLTATEKSPNPTLDTNAIYGLRETRVPSGAANGTCTAPMVTPPTSFSGTVVSGMLADNLVLTTGQAAFEYDTANKVVIVRLRTVDTARGQGLQYTPALAKDPYTLRVFARNIN